MGDSGRFHRQSDTQAGFWEEKAGIHLTEQCERMEDILGEQLVYIFQNLKTADTARPQKGDKQQNETEEPGLK